MKLQHSRSGTPKRTQTVKDATQKETAIDQQQHSCETLICQRLQTILRLLSSAATASTRWRVRELNCPTTYRHALTCVTLAEVSFVLLQFHMILFLIGILCEVSNTLYGDHICPFVCDLLSATKPCHIFIKFSIRILHQKLSNKLELCEKRHCT